MEAPRARFELNPRHSVWARFKNSLKTSCSAETTTHDSENGASSTNKPHGHKLQPSTTRDHADHDDDTEESENELVEKTIVDNERPPELWRSGKVASNAGYTATNTGHHPTAKSVASSHHSDAQITTLRQFYNFLRYRLFPHAAHFCNPRYANPDEEDAFQKEVSPPLSNSARIDRELQRIDPARLSVHLLVAVADSPTQNWHDNKTMAIFGGIYLILVWLLSFAVPRPWSTWNQVQIYAVAPFLTLPLIPASQSTRSPLLTLLPSLS